MYIIGLFLSVCLSVLSRLDHALSAKSTDVIFGMHTHVTPKSKIGYLNLNSEVIWGQWRSKTVNWGHWRQHFKTTPSDAIFCMYTHMTPRNNVGYVKLTSEVKGGHQRSKLRGQWRSNSANWGHTLMKALRDAIFCMYNLIVSINIWDGTILTSEVIWGHWRSKTSK